MDLLLKTSGSPEGHLEDNNARLKHSELLTQLSDGGGGSSSSSTSRLMKQSRAKDC